MQISASRRPASSPPGTALPQSTSRAPAGQRLDRDPQRVRVGGEAVRELVCALVEGEGHRGSSRIRISPRPSSRPSPDQRVYAALDLLVGHRQAELAQPAQAQAQERRAVGAGPRVGRQEGRPRSWRRCWRAACPRPGWAPSAPRATIVPASARRPGGRAGAPGDGDQPAPQAGARLLAGVAVDEDLAAAHAGARPGVGAAEPAAGGAAHDQPPAAHARRRPSRPRRPRRRARRPRIPAPACGPAPPASVRRPPVMPAPRPATRARSPSTRTSSAPAPETANSSPSAARRLPCQSSSRSISARLRPASRSGRQRLGGDRRRAAARAA